MRVSGARLAMSVRQFSSYDESQSTDGEPFNININSTGYSFLFSAVLLDLYLFGILLYASAVSWVLGEALSLPEFTI